MRALPDLRLLTTFIAVVDSGSMAAASARLGYVPSAVSQHISALERALGVELMARKPGQRVTLTGAGRAVEKAARSLFVAVAAYQDVACRVADSEVAELRIGAFPTCLSHLLPRVLEAFVREEPGVGWQLLGEETPEGLPLVKSGDIDLLLAYRYLPEDAPPRDDKDLSIRPLGREPLVLVSSGAHAPMTLEDCRERDWVAGYRENADNRLLRGWAREFNLEPRIPYETTDSNAFLGLVEAGLAVGLLPATVARRSLLSEAIRPVVLPPSARFPSREILAVTRATYSPAVVERLLDRLRDELRRIVADVPPGPPTGAAYAS